MLFSTNLTAKLPMALFKRSSRSKRAPTKPLDATASDFEEITDEDIERFLLQSEAAEAKQGFWNVSTATGLGFVAVGTAFLLQELGLWGGVDLNLLAAFLPWLGATVIILVGFGLLSKQRKKDTAQASTYQSPEPDKDADNSSGSQGIGQAAKAFAQSIRQTAARKRLTRSPDKKVAGVCAGLAAYLDVDPTLVRIAFVLATLFAGGAPILLYLALIFAMPKADENLTGDTHITVTRS